MCAVLDGIPTVLSVINGGSLHFPALIFFLCVQGLATIPVSAFYSSEHGKEFEKYIRFCFVKVLPTTLVGCKFSLLTSLVLYLPYRRTQPWMLQLISSENGVKDSEEDPSS